MKTRKITALMIVAVLIVGLFASCNTPAKAPDPVSAVDGATTKDSPATTPETPAVTDGAPINIKFYGKVIEYTSGPLMCDALSVELEGKYNLEMIQVDWSNLDKVIRTGIASNEPCDVYNYAGNEMINFKDQAVDLTPYLDANDGEWRKSFDPSVLDMCVVDGKILAIPWEVNFPAIMGNSAAFEAAGVTIPESWTFEEFMAACEKLQAAGYFPFATPMDLGQGGWLYRNAIMSSSMSSGTYDDYIAGDLDFSGPETKAALDAIKALYDAKYMYPGDGAIIAKKDEIQAAFQQEKVAMIANVAAGARELVADSSFEAVSIPWPNVGGTSAISGVANVLFIPQNSKNIEAAVEVIKAYTSASIQAIHGDLGYLPANINVDIADPFVQGLAKQAKEAYGFEFPSTTAMTDYYRNNLMPDLILNGGEEEVIMNLEMIRQEYLTSK